jgi:4,5-DOPA dioxygenase extradiol
MDTNRMPVIFVGHGSPMNAIEENEFSQAWAKIGQELPHPKAILCVSAHWETPEPQVTAMEKPRTIHDFYGFPQELNDMQYPAPGSPQLAERVLDLLADHSVKPDQSWGLDHGTWSVLARMFPAADIPVVQLSLAHTRDGQFHFDLGAQLMPLREEGILVMGSGNVVHNLGRIQWSGGAYDWADEFDKQVKDCIDINDPTPLIKFQDQGKAVMLSINSAEHYLPLLYILGLRQPEDPIRYYCDKVVYGSLSMRCVRFG